MVNNNEMLLVYFDSLINNVYKILPLYEEKNEYLDTYLNSLLFELYGLENAINISDSFEYISLLSILESIRKELLRIDVEKKILKREVFKCIGLIKKIMSNRDGK